MKIKVQISAIVLLTALHSAPAHAMLARLSQAAVRSNAFNAGKRLSPLAGSQPLLKPNLSLGQPTLLARSLAAQQAEGSSSDNNTRSGYNQSKNSDDSQGEQRSWWRQWESKFRNENTAYMLGGCGFSTLTGLSYYPEYNICQTPEDACDLEKIKQTTDYYKQAPSCEKKKIEQFALNNLHTLSASRKGQRLIRIILEKNPSIAKSFKQILDRHASQASTSPCQRETFRLISITHTDHFPPPEPIKPRPILTFFTHRTQYDHILKKTGINDEIRVEIIENSKFSLSIFFLKTKKDFYLCKTEKLVASCHLNIGLHGIYIAHLCVDNKYRNNGYGHALLTIIKQIAMEKRMYKLTLWAVPEHEDEAANLFRFYEKNGFVHSGEFSTTSNMACDLTPNKASTVAQACLNNSKQSRLQEAE